MTEQNFLDIAHESLAWMRTKKGQSAMRNSKLYQSITTSKTNNLAERACKMLLFVIWLRRPDYFASMLRNNTVMIAKYGDEFKN